MEVADERGTREAALGGIEDAGVTKGEIVVSPCSARTRVCDITTTRQT